MSDNKEKKKWSDGVKKAGLTGLASLAPLLAGCQQEVVTIPTTSGGVATVNTITEYDAKKFLKSEIASLLKSARELDRHNDVNFIKPAFYIETKDGFFEGMGVTGVRNYLSHSKEGGGGTLYGFGGATERNFEKNKNFMDSLQSALDSLNKDDYHEMQYYIGDARDRLPRTDNPERKSEIQAKLVDPVVNIYNIVEAMSRAASKGTLFKSGVER